MDDSNFSSSNGSDVIVRSESNHITIDVDLSTKESVINVGTQNVHTKIGTSTCKTDKCMYTFNF